MTQSLPWGVYAPIQLVLYDLDLRLWGFEPLGFYCHHLLWLVATSLSLYLLARQWLRVGWALLVSALFVVMPAPFLAASELMNRHYFVGVVCAALASALYLRWLTKGGWMRLACACALFVAACLARVVFLPLGLVPALLPDSPRNRVGSACGVLLGGAYLGLRRSMLGTWFGGAGMNVGLPDLPSTLTDLPPVLAKTLFGDWSAGSVLLLCATVAAAFILGRMGGRGLWLSAAAAFLFMLPIVPVTPAMAARHGVVLSAVWVLAIASAAQWSSRRSRAASALLGAATALGWGATFVMSTVPRATAISAESREGRFYFGLGADDVLRGPRSPRYVLEDIGWLRQHLDLGPSAFWFHDDYYLCGHDLDDTSVVFSAADASAREFVPTPDLASLAQGYCSSLIDTPLEIDVVVWDEGVRWQLGPERQGEYFFLLDDDRTRVPVAPRGSFRGRFPPDWSYRVKYESPDGWATVSRRRALTVQPATP